MKQVLKLNSSSKDAATSEKERVKGKLPGEQVHKLFGGRVDFPVRYVHVLLGRTGLISPVPHLILRRRVQGPVQGDLAVGLEGGEDTNEVANVLCVKEKFNSQVKKDF